MAPRVRVPRGRVDGLNAVRPQPRPGRRLERVLLSNLTVGPPTDGQGRLSLMETASMSTKATIGAAGPARRRLAEASPWAGLLATHRSAMARSQKLGRAFAAAEEAAFAARRERRLVPAPAELVLGERLPKARIVTEEAMLSFFPSDAGLFGEKHAALARWRAQQAAADAETAYSAAVEAEEAANRAWTESQDEADRALHEVLRFPTAAADDIATKRGLLDSNPCIDQTVELEMIIDAVLANLRRI